MQFSFNNEEIYKKIRSILNSKIFISIFYMLIMLSYASILGVTEFKHDAYDYWSSWDMVITDKGINLALFPSLFRGYFGYLLIYIFKQLGCLLGNPYLGWRLLATGLTTLIFLYILPYLLGGVIESRKTIIPFIKYMFLLFILIYFWGDFIVHPSSDLLSCYFFIILAGLWKYTMGLKGVNKFSCYLIIGGLSYATYNTRVVFLYAIIALFVFYIIKEYMANPLWKERRKIFIYLLAFLVGGLFVSYPQMKINYEHTDEYSPLVNTEGLYGEGKDLKYVQLYWGVSTPRYETYDGDLNLYKENGVHFYDETGKEILKREGLNDSTILQPKQLIKLLLKYPGDMIGIYVKHFANIMIPLWRYSYIMNLYTNKLFVILFSIIIWFIFLLDFSQIKWSKERIKIKNESIFFTICAIIPAIMQTLGQVEIRFFYICYALLYYYVCIKVNWKNLWESTKKKRLFIFITFLIMTGLWISVIGDTLADNKHRIMLINEIFIK